MFFVSPMSSSGVNAIDLFASFKWSSILSCAIRIPFALFYGFYELSNLSEAQPEDTSFYSRHDTQLVNHIINLVVLSFGIYADITEKFLNVLIFVICLTLLVLYDVLVLCLTYITFLGVVAIIVFTCLLLISWIYLLMIHRRAKGLSTIWI